MDFPLWMFTFPKTTMYFLAAEVLYKRSGLLSAFLDGIETFNMHPYHNARIGIAAQYAKAHPHLITTCGTDFHHENHQGLGGILTKTLPRDSFELAELLESKDFLFSVAGNVVIP